MNKNWFLSCTMLFALVSAPFMGVTAASAAKMDTSILTTTELRSLPPLKETDRIEPTGQVKTFTLDLKDGKWELVKGTTVDAITVNGSIPGPEIRVTEGDTVRITVVNNLKEETSIHWHGLHVPNDMDGVPPLTQQGIRPGESFTYEFLANHAGTFMYHSHLNSVKQIDKGLYGSFIIDPQKPEQQPKFDQDITWMLGGWKVDDMSSMEIDSSMGSMDYNYWTINGKAFPDTQVVTVKKGEVVRMRLINISNAAHPMHLHGHDFRIIAEDGHPIAQPQVMNTIDVAPGKIYDIEFIADNPGTWVFHCHELHHTMNGEVEPGGLIGVIQYEGQTAPDTAPKADRAQTENDSLNEMKDMKEMTGMEETTAISDMNDTMANMDHSTMASFTDMEQHPAASYVHYLHQKGIVEGVGDGLFLPDQAMQVQHLNTLLSRITGKELKLDSTERATVFQKLVDVLGMAEQAGTMSNKETSELLAGYKDISGLDETERKTTAYLVQKGILNPEDDKQLLRPEEDITRAEAATVLAKLIQKNLIQAQK